MKVNCSRQELGRGLSIVNHAAGSRSSLPILSNLLFVAETDKIKLTATNLEITITCEIPATVLEPGSTTVPAKLMNDYINALTAVETQLESLPGGAHGLRVRSLGSEANMRGMDPAEYPSRVLIDDNEPSLSLDTNIVKSMIAQTFFAAATDDARPVFTSVLARTREGKLTFAAADTFRLAVSNKLTESTDYTVADVLIPARSLNELSKILPSEGIVQCYFSTPNRNQVFFKMPGIEFSAQTSEGQFPNFETIIPKETSTRVIVSTDDVRAAIKQALLFSKSDTSSNIVSLIVTPGSHGLTPGAITLQATNDEFGDARKVIDATVDGPEVTILFNGKFLAEVLNVLSANQIVFELNSPQTPGIVKSYGDDSYIHVIMPLYSRR